MKRIVDIIKTVCVKFIDFILSIAIIVASFYIVLFMLVKFSKFCHPFIDWMAYTILY